MTDGAAAVAAGAPPLTGIRVLDFTRVIAGPYITMTLADLGAEVIKIENPEGGDDTRALQPPGIAGESAFFMAVNRHKKSVALDLATPAGRAIARRLALKSDVLVENFRPGVMARMGLDHGSLRDLNPRLVYCSISGYGQDGPFRAVAGYDPVMQAETGLMYLTGDPAFDPVRAGGSITDTLSGLHAGMAILAALHAREGSGRGRHVDIALHDACLASTCFVQQGALIGADDPVRLGNATSVLVPAGVYACRDGAIMLMCGNDRQFQRLCIDVLDRPDLADDPRCRTIVARREHRAVLDAAIAAAFAGDTRDYWMRRLRQAGVPGGAVRTITEALASEEATARGMVRELHHPRAGPIRTVASPLNLSATPVRKPGPAPLLGEHTASVLADLLGDDAAAAEG